ncbi:MAG: MBL fold metallo-hydrolase [Sandaracinaceae bacterium]
MERSRRRRIVLRVLGVLALAVLALATFALIDGWRAFGQAADGARRERMDASPHWSEGESSFVNPEPLYNDWGAMITGVMNASAYGSPNAPIATVPGDRSRFGAPPASGLRVTWLGHSILVIEIDGYTVLTDPVFGERTSPFTWAGPERFYPTPIVLDQLPPIDLVLISHDHYDHLDYPTIQRMREWETTFVAPLGVGAHLAYWGVDEEHIVDVDWWDRVEHESLTVVCTPARHASGRTGIDKDATLWAGFALIGPNHRAFYSGDTGLFPAMAEIGERFGPFDVTMIESGAYDSAWPDWHLGPEQAVLAHQLVRGDVLIPVHWGLFNLAYHSWTEPAERVLAAAEEAHVRAVVPRPGESVEPAAPPEVERWWPDVPWRTADEAPVVATRIPSSLLEGLLPRLPARTD